MQRTKYLILQGPVGLRIQPYIQHSELTEEKKPLHFLYYSLPKKICEFPVHLGHRTMIVVQGQICRKCMHGADL